MTQAYHPEDATLEQRAALADLEAQVYGPPDPAEAAAGSSAWPDPVTRYGLLGEVVDVLDPTTEADPSAVYFALLAFAGTYIGADRYAWAGGVRHPGRIWPVITGHTASGAKGTAISAMAQFADFVGREFLTKNKASGLSSSEGLITKVRDGRGDDPEDPKFDEGVADKRLLVIEDEYASVLGRIRREGNTLSATVREAYDGKPLQTMTSGNPLYASGYMINILSQITPGELVAKMTGDDVGNGFANRFMLVASKRSKYISAVGLRPDGRRLENLAGRFRLLAAQRGEIRHNQAAADLWHQHYVARHEQLAAAGDGPLVALAARWHANALRIQVILATLDGADHITADHVQASLDAVDYTAATARHVFAGEKADPELGKLAEFVDGAEIGCTRTMISRDLFRNNKPREEIDSLIARLLQLGRYREMAVPNDRGTRIKHYVRVGRGHAAAPSGDTK